MKLFIWMTGLALFLLGSASTLLQAPLQIGLAQSTGSEHSASGTGDESQRLEVDAGFTTISALARKNFEQTERAFSRLDTRATKRIKEVVGRLEMGGARDDTQLLGNFRSVLQSLRASLELEFLSYIPLGGKGKALAVGETGDLALTAEQAAELRTRVGDRLSFSNTLVGVEYFPLRSGASPLPCIVTARSIWARSDAPSGILLGGRSLGSLVLEFENALSGRPALRCHLFSNSVGTEGARVILGDGVGSEVRQALVAALEKNETSTEMPFLTGDREFGKWGRFRSIRGELAVGWGVTSVPGKPAVTSPISSNAAPIPNVQSKLTVLFERWFGTIVIVSGVLLGLLILGLFLRSWVRRKESFDDYGPSPVAIADGRKILARLDVLFGEMQKIKNSATSTTGGSLRESEIEAPQVLSEIKTLKAQFNASTQELGEMFAGAMNQDSEGAADDLRKLRESVDKLSEVDVSSGDSAIEAAARKIEGIEEAVLALSLSLDNADRQKREDEDNENVVVARLAELAASIEGLRADHSDRLTAAEDAEGNESGDRLSAEWRDFSERFGQLEASLLASRAVEDERVERRVDADVSRLQRDWDSEKNTLHKEIEETRTLGEKLVKDLEETQKTESGLRDELERLQSQSGDLTDRLAEEVAIRNEGSQREEDLLGQLQEREHGEEVAIARLRELEEHARQLEEERRETNDLEADRDRVRGLEVALEEQRAEIGTSVDRHRLETEQLRDEIQGVQDFQGSLIQGNLPLPVLAVDPELKIFVWNPAVESLFNLPSTKVLGQNFANLDLGCAELQGKIIDESQAALRNRLPVSTEIEVFLLGGKRELSLKVFYEPILADDDHPRGVIVSILDRTETLQTQREAEIHEHFQESLTRSIPVALVVTDDEHRVILWNRHAERILKADESEALGQNLLELDSRLRTEHFRNEFRAAEKAAKPTRFQTMSEKGTNYIVTFSPFYDRDDRSCGHLLLVERAAQTKIAPAAKTRT